MRQLIGESRQDILETWDDKRYLFLSVTSGEVEIRMGNEGVSSTKVSIVERPGLNNSTGQRLWDCAIGLACFLSLHSDALDSAVPLTTTTSSDDEKPRTKRQTTAGLEGPLRVVELGAGCALASMCAQHVLAHVEGKLSIVATDVKPTVETTLAENLAANSVSSRQPAITASVLDWGTSTCLQVCDARPPSSPSSPPPHLTLLGSDILYNPSSHSLLLDTLLAFCRPTNSSLTASARALIAYKKRTDGDGAFFGMASKAGLDVRKVWEWGEVGVWSFE
ncbi:SPOSA6832_02067, partial [Sporobolomyces salmonicolor]